MYEFTENKYKSMMNSW